MTDSQLTTKTILSARKYHVCKWCGEEIEKGSEYEQVRIRRGKQVQHFACHPECLEALDNSRFHQGAGDPLFIPMDTQIRGEYDCPFDSGDGSCDMCQDTPFRRLERGNKKPAMKALEARKPAFFSTDDVVTSKHAMEAGWMSGGL